MAHAVWSVSGGETLIPILAYERDGKRSFHHAPEDRIETGVAKGKEWLDENPEDASCAVLIFDSYFTFDWTRTDALVAQIVAYEPGREALRIVVPYRHASLPEGFAVNRPKVIREDLDRESLKTIGQAFFRGVEAHKQGSEIWSKHLDESF